MKRKYESDYSNMLPQTSDVPNDTFNNLQNNDENVVNITRSYDVKNAETVNNTSNNVDDIENESIKDLEDSNNYNPQYLTTEHQQTSNSNPNYMLPWYERKSPSKKLQQKIINLPSEKIAKIIDYHLGAIIENYRHLWIEVNRMVRKLQDENPNWKLSRIIYSIYETNKDTENYIPFNPIEIKKHLDTKNKELFGIFKKDKPIQDMKSIEDLR